MIDPKATTASPLARVIVLSGPSGGGKSRLAARLGLPVLPLDDFYRDESDPDLPRRATGVDWESVQAWNLDAALAAVVTLCTAGAVDVPVYSFSDNRAVGRRQIRLEGAAYVVVEGLFAIDVVPRLRERGLLAVALVLANPRHRTFVRRLLRDVADRRKPVPTILRLGVAKYRSDPAIVRELVAAGATPMTNATAEAYLRGLTSGPVRG